MCDDLVRDFNKSHCCRASSSKSTKNDLFDSLSWACSTFDSMAEIEVSNALIFTIV